MRLPAVLTGMACSAALAVVSCSTTDDSTQLTVVLTSEASIPTEVNLLTVTVESNGSTSGPYVTDLSRDSDGYFPQTVALIPRDGDSVSQPVTVSVSAQYQADDDAGEPTGALKNVVLRSAVASYVQGRTLLLPMPLRMACFAASCGQGQSCVGGVCVSAVVDPSSLVDYRPEYVFPTPEADGGTTGCFDDSVCIGASTLASFDAPSCTFDFPAGSTDVNASIRWEAANERIIVLDGDDPREGWTPVPGSSKGLLSKGVCAALAGQLASSPAEGLYLSTACPAKPHLLPHCDSRQGVGVAIP